MKLKFLGNGSGFSETHTNAYFEQGNDFVIIDLSLLNLKKLLSLKPYEKETYLFITHMHDDHVSGVTLLVQHYFYLHNKKLNLVVPRSIVSDIKIDFFVKGLHLNMVNLIIADDFIESVNCSWFKGEVIYTKHSPELDGKCAGYVFYIDDTKCVYSGDTCILEPYIPYLRESFSPCEFYVDIAADYGIVHLKYEDVRKKLYMINSYCVDIYMMHIDNAEKLSLLISGTPFKMVTI